MITKIMKMKLIYILCRCGVCVSRFVIIQFCPTFYKTFFLKFLRPLLIFVNFFSLNFPIFFLSICYSIFSTFSTFFQLCPNFFHCFIQLFPVCFLFVFNLFAIFPPTFFFNVFNFFLQLVPFFKFFPELFSNFPSKGTQPKL